MKSRQAKKASKRSRGATALAIALIFANPFPGHLERVLLGEFGNRVVEPPVHRRRQATAVDAIGKRSRRHPRRFEPGHERKEA